jgi:hypothetical protein
VASRNSLVIENFSGGKLMLRSRGASLASGAWAKARGGYDSSKGGTDAVAVDPPL